MKQRLMVTFLAAGLIALGAGIARADWSDDFESYVPGGGIHGQGGWEGWDGDAGADAQIATLFAHSGTQSLAVLGTTDIVQQFSGYTSGNHVFSCWQMIRSTHTGEHFFLLLNTYAHGGPYNWSAQISFSQGTVRSDFDLATLPWITDEWVELRFEIDLDNNMQLCFYGGNLLYIKSWTEGVSGGGALNIGAVDLYGNASRTVYYDDFSLTLGTVPTVKASWGEIKNLYR